MHLGAWHCSSNWQICVGHDLPGVPISLLTILTPCLVVLSTFLAGLPRGQVKHVVPFWPRGQVGRHLVYLAYYVEKLRVGNF